jgi:acyl phosphate:glycerol-3-phosphate acyltransferase
MISDYLNINNILILIICYLIGSIPWGYIVVKLFTKDNILSKGSGNVGAMNSYDITKKKWIGIVVFLLDAGKGFLAVYIARKIGWDVFLSTSIGAVSVILGHNYSIFLRFKGGRGLASAVGALLLINPYPVIAWALMWLVGYFAIMKNVHVANITATILTPLVIYSSPAYFTYTLTVVPYAPKMDFINLITVICIIIMIKHIKPLRELLAKK